MGLKRPKKFRKDAVRIALTSGLTRKQVADDLGVGMSTLNNWITAHRDTYMVSKEDLSLTQENDRLRRENRILKEEREILNNRSGPHLACARYKQPVPCWTRRAVADGLLVGWAPLKKRGTWADWFISYRSIASHPTLRSQRLSAQAFAAPAQVRCVRRLTFEPKNLLRDARTAGLVKLHHGKGFTGERQVWAEGCRSPQRNIWTAAVLQARSQPIDANCTGYDL